MGTQKLTTRDLFRTIGQTERVRSARADNVFRQLRNQLSNELRSAKACSTQTPSMSQARPGSQTRPGPTRRALHGDLFSYK